MVVCTSACVRQSTTTKFITRLNHNCFYETFFFTFMPKQFFTANELSENALADIRWRIKGAVSTTDNLVVELGTAVQIQNTRRFLLTHRLDVRLTTPTEASQN